FSTIRPSPSSTLFPYTTLFRSSLDSYGLLWHRGAQAALPPPFTAARQDGARGCRAPLVAAPFAAHPGPSGPPEPSGGPFPFSLRSEEHTSELQSRENLVCRLLL